MLGLRKIRILNEQKPTSTNFSNLSDLNRRKFEVVIVELRGAPREWYRRWIS
jgi:hypothetical protein